MPPLSPFKHRLALIKDALSWNDNLIYEVLLWHRRNLPSQGIEVSWTRDGEYIVGSIQVDGSTFMTQGKTAQEFVEMVNDALYAAYNVPLRYAQQLGGLYRLLPSEQEFARLNDVAVEKSSINFVLTPVVA